MKNILDISAAIEAHLSRAGIVLSKHSQKVNAAVLIIQLSEQVFRVDGIELNLTELQEEIQDIAEVIDALRNDALDILSCHIEFAREIRDDLNGVIKDI